MSFWTIKENKKRLSENVNTHEHDETRTNLRTELKAECDLFIPVVNESCILPYNSFHLDISDVSQNLNH